VASIDRDSKEIRTFTLTEAHGDDLSADTVEVAIIPTGTRPDVTDWIACAWTAGTPGSVDVPINLPGGFTLTTPGTYHRYVRLTDSPEVPVIRATDSLTVS
jgi:hypothetical protein